MSGGAEGQRQNAEGVPEGWRHVLIDSVARRGSGHTPNKGQPDYWNGGIKWVSLADSSRLDNRFISETDKEISLLGIRNSSAVLLPKGTVVLSRDAGVGKSAILAEDMAVSQHFMTWTADEENTHSIFLYYWLQNKKPEFEAIATGSTIKTIGLPYFKKLNILLPPLPEQRKIAAILSTWDDSLATLTNLLAAKRQQKRGLAEALLTGKKRLPGFAGEWKRVRVGDVFRVQKGTQKNRMSLADVGTYPVINGGITPSGFTEEFNTEGNTVTVSEGGNSCGFISLQKDRFWCGGHCYTIQSDAIPVDFQYQILKGQESQIMGLRVGSGLPNIQKKALEAFELNLPTDSAEQQAIASILSTLDGEIASLEALRAKVQEQKRGLMDELLTGRVRVQVDAD